MKGIFFTRSQTRSKFRCSILLFALNFGANIIARSREAAISLFGTAIDAVTQLNAAAAYWS